MKLPIYLDYNATAPLRPQVAAAMAEWAGLPLNPSSVHGAGRLAKRLIEDARALVADACACFANEVIFTASATEANNMVLRGFPSYALLVAATEHASIAKPASQLGADILPVGADGIVDLEILEQKLRSLARPALVSVMLANNETGVIQPIAAIADIVHAHGGLLHSDAVQAVGKIPVDMGLLKVDMLTLCGHKAGGAVGVGALLLRNDIAIKPLLLGGGQELGRRAGSEPVAAMVGFAALMKLITSCPEAARLRALQQRLESGLKAILPHSVIHGEAAPRLPNTTLLSFFGHKSETLLMQCDLAGFAVSAGSACSSGRIAASHVLVAMGAQAAEIDSALRISYGWATTEAEIDAFLTFVADRLAPEGAAGANNRKQVGVS